MRHPEFPVVSFLCFFFLLCLSPPHIKSGSVSTMALIAWMAVMSLIRGVNSLIWAGNVELKFEVWCDITTKLMVGFTFAIPAAALCILRHLESIVSTRQAQILTSDRRKRQKIEILMCFGIPVLFMILHYVVQGHRFDLIENFGCSPTVYLSVAGLCIIYIPPILISLTSFFYAGNALRHILRHRMEFASHLQSHAGISSGTYVRLMALAMTVMLWDTGVNAYIIWFNANFGLRHWKSWGDVHSGFSRVQLVPAMFLTPHAERELVFQWWILPVSCMQFFIFFGFGRESLSNYQQGIIWFRCKVLRQNISKPPSYGNSGLPSYRSRSGTSHVTVRLPSVSDKNSEQKPWDALSLEMPEGTELETSTLSSKDRFSLSLDEHSTPVAISELPSVNSGFPPHPSRSSGNDSHSNLPENVPALIITKPSNVALRRDVSPATCARATSRQSMTTDFGITVSPAYFPEAGTAARYHEEAFLARDSQGAAPVSDNPLRRIQTVEKSQV